MSYILQMDTDPYYYDFNGVLPKAISKIEFTDSLFNFFPVVSFSMADEAGVMYESVNLEGLKFNIKLYEETDPTKYNITSKYTTLADNFVSQKIQSTLNGYVAYNLINAFALDIGIQSKYFKKYKIKDLIEKVVSDTFNSNKISNKYISDTRGTDNWYIASEHIDDFIRKMSGIAVSPNNVNDIFFTFFNNQNEFYFYCLEDLFKQQPVRNLYLSVSKILRREDALYNYEFNKLNFSNNMSDYNKEMYFLNGSGDFEKYNSSIENHIIKSNKNFLPILKNMKDTKFSKSTSDFIGFKESTDVDNYLGMINEEFADTALGIRGSLSCLFDPNLSAGKLINLSIDSGLYEGVPNYEWSGNWLITQSTHTYNWRGNPMTNIAIAKPSLRINDKNTLQKEMVAI